jgi:hypothetical protein
VNEFTWRDFLTRVDIAPFNGPVCLCLDQIVSAADEGDFLLMAALANLGRDVAKKCGDPIAEATLCIHLGLASRALGDAATAENLLQRAKRGLWRFPGASARQNEAIAAIVLAGIDESKARDKHRACLLREDGLSALGWYSDALALLRKACRAHAERGDRKAHSIAAEMCRWVEQRVDTMVPRVYVDGQFESRDADSSDGTPGKNGARPLAAVADNDSIWRPEPSGGSRER